MGGLDPGTPSMTFICSNRAYEQKKCPAVNEFSKISGHLCTDWECREKKRNSIDLSHHCSSRTMGLQCPPLDSSSDITGTRWYPPSSDVTYIPCVTVQLISGPSCHMPSTCTVKWAMYVTAEESAEGTRAPEATWEVSTGSFILFYCTPDQYRSFDKSQKTGLSIYHTLKVIHRWVTFVLLTTPENIFVW